MKRILVCISILSSLLFFAGEVAAVDLPAFAPFCNLNASLGECDLTMGYKAIDLPDVTPGQDSWQYNYTFLDTTHADTWLTPSPGSPVTSMSDTFHVGDLLALVFANSTGVDNPYYTNIEAITNGDWSFQYVGGGVDLGDQNEVIWYRPLVDSPSLEGLGAKFIWNHSGTPGSQTFAFSDANSPGFTYDLYQNTTQTPVPEPSTLLLLGSGLAGLGFERRKFKA